jgi:4-phytase/acid phosphatase
VIHLNSRFAASIALLYTLGVGSISNGQAPSPAESRLKFVVIVSRHGVRSPTGKTDQLNQYSRQPWPKWNVPPGYLTEHGAQLMTIFGTYDRAQFAAEGLLSPKGCADAEHIRIIADSDQRTRETGKALATGLAPGCKIDVAALPEGTADPLFHYMGTGVGHPDKMLATAAVSGRIGGNPQGLIEAYRPQLLTLESVLRGCDPGAACTTTTGAVPQSIFDIPSSLASGKGDHLVELHSPLGTASTMAENILLEYTEGMDASNVGWGRVDLRRLRELVQLHTANEDISGRTGCRACISTHTC